MGLAFHRCFDSRITDLLGRLLEPTKFDHGLMRFFAPVLIHITIAATTAPVPQIMSRIAPTGVGTSRWGPLGKPEHAAARATRRA
jgi:hypothetical protein